MKTAWVFLRWALVFALGLGACTRKEPPKAIPPSSIAELKEPVGDVKSRKAKTLVWMPASEGLPLDNYDAVMTGAQARAVVLFKNAYRLDLADNTMVIVLDREVRQNVEKTVVALPSGSIDGEVSSQTTKEVELVVRTRRGWIRASRDKKTGKGARFQATVSTQGTLKVESRGGEVVVATQESERPVPRGETLTVETRAGETPGPESPLNAKAEDFAALPTAKAVPVVPALPAVEERPRFVIQEPRHKQVVFGDTIEVKGKMLGPLTVYLNGVQLRPASGGAFATQVAVTPGINLLTFQVVDTRSKWVRYETREVVRKSSDAPKE